LSVAIAEKSRVKEFAVIDGTAAALLALLELVELGVPLLPQAAIRRAALPATAVRPAFLEIEYNVTTSLVSGTRGRHARGRVPGQPVTAGRSLLGKP